MRVLLTGFEAFGSETENPSSMVLELIPDAPDGLVVDKLVLPVSFRRCCDRVNTFLQDNEVDAIVALGQAGGRADISIERVALNLMDAKKADNDGFQPKGMQVVDGAPAAYVSAVAVAELCAAVKEAGVPCHVSNSAGLYVCNALYYRLMHEFSHILSVFVHLPYTLRQAVGKSATTPSMSVETMARALTAILRKLWECAVGEGE